MNDQPAYLWKIALAGLALCLAPAVRAAPDAEPEPGVDAPAAPDAAVTNAPEPWVRTPAERAWEDILDANLGKFYLDGYKQAKARGLETAWDYVHDDPALPRVLLVGDSISRGYTVAVRHALAGKANVHRAPRNCGSTQTAFSTNRVLHVQQLELWLGDGRWDVIHFNFGIHDLRLGLEEYPARLERIVRRLKQTGARLIFANTVHGPDSTDALVVQFNRAAAEVMARHDVPVNDLYAYMQPRKAEFRIALDNSHFKDTGNRYLGEKVAETIQSYLPTTPAGIPAQINKD